MKTINKKCPIEVWMKVIIDNKGRKRRFFFYHYQGTKQCANGNIIKTEFPHEVLEKCTLKCIKQGRRIDNNKSLECIVKPIKK